MAKQLHILIVPHTHWDREWYQTFQQFRARLVKTVDNLLDILDRDEQFSYFMLDGQTIVLDDYLEVQPEQTERLQRYTRAGRILVGPWYVQPDEFLVSAESLIRNLQIGLQRATEFGTPMRVGYVPDSFGHIAQLPQILQGCGIDNAVFWRGVGAETQYSEFHWAAPDGSTVLVIFLADPIGYSNARQLPLNPEEFVARVELLAANILPRATTDTLLLMNGSDHLEPQEGLPATIEAANNLLSHIDPKHKKILFASKQQHTKHYDAIHMRIGTLPQYIEYVRQQHTPLATLHGEMRSSQHAHLLPAVLSTRIWLKQQNTATEHLLQHWVEPLTAWAAALGSPYPRGLLRLAWRSLLQNHAHDSICGCSIDQVHQENRVRFAHSQQIGESILAPAIQHIVAQIDTRAPFPVPHASHEPLPIVLFNPAPGPHNSEMQTVVQLPGSLHNAVIVDQHGAHMPYRVINRWIQEIGSMPVAREMLATATTLAGVTTPSQLIQMAHTMISSALGQSEDTYVISRVYIENYIDSPIHHTPHPPQPGIIYIEIMLAPTGRVVVNEQELEAAGAHILSFLQRDDIHTLHITVVDQARETIEFLAANLPAYGYKTFWLYPRGLKEPLPANPSAALPTPTTSNTLIAEQNSIENEFYHVEVSIQDATLTVTDKQTGSIFTGLNRFVDGGDVGDLYTYCPPERDTLVSEPVEAVKVELINAGPVRTTLRVSGRWAFPSSCTTNRSERNLRLAICPIVSDISLTPGVQRVDIHTSIDNKVKDHRLRVLFPVTYPVEHSVAEGSFEVRQRPVALPQPADLSEWAEAPVNTFPQKRFVDLNDGTTGLAVLNRGLPEYEVLQAGPGLADGQTALALTLLRCVEWLSRGDLATRQGHAGPMEHTPEAQCPGYYEFDYALLPHQGTWETAEALVLREAQSFNTPISTRAVVATSHPGQLASQASLIEVEPRSLVVSALKRSNNTQELIVRIYNPLDYEVDAQIRLGLAFTQVFVANLLEEHQYSLEIPANSQSIQVNIRGGGITTLAFV